MERGLDRGNQASSSGPDLSDALLASARGSLELRGPGRKQEASASSPCRPRVAQRTGPTKRIKLRAAVHRWALNPKVYLIYLFY